MAENERPLSEEHRTPPLTQESLRKMMSGTDHGTSAQPAPNVPVVRSGASKPNLGIRPPSAGQPVPKASANSQAGLAAHRGAARILSVPSSPAPGEPGSRFNPIVREREQPEREPVDQSNTVPSFDEWRAAREGAQHEASQDSVAKAATSGFVDGFSGGVIHGKSDSRSADRFDRYPELRGTGTGNPVTDKFPELAESNEAQQPAPEADEGYDH